MAFGYPKESSRNCRILTEQQHETKIQESGRCGRIGEHTSLSRKRNDVGPSWQ